MSNRPIADHDTPDPWIIASPFQRDLFYLTFTLGNRIEIWSSSSIESFHDRNPSIRKSTIWQPPGGSPWSADIWAPELHFLFGTWYIYAAAAQPGQGNPSHRTIVLRSSNPSDPLDRAAWHFEGPLKGLPHDQWSIDATVFSPDPGLSSHSPDGRGGYPDDQRRWYIVYSGWPLGDHSDTQQDLFIANLRSPLEAHPQSLQCISRAELPWERPENGRRGVNEGPSWVDIAPTAQSPGWRGIVYSAHGSWTSEYKLAVVQYTGGPQDDCCNPALWRKRQHPLLVSDKAAGGPFGPGHASFVPSPYNDGAVFCIYHGTEREDEGWANRKGRVLCLQPNCFTDQSATMCCAYTVCGPVQGGMMPGQVGGQHAHGHHGQSSNQYPGQHGQNQSQVPVQQGHGSAGRQGGLDKYTAEIEKRIPQQYQGYFNKAKKFFK
ncbi:hypothetical protein LTS08_000860 [Lithohypha guttulata]|uniref:Alpha-L-arabinofuranosidase II n=1 Tax=Lithohypha guttulata TaxID=1690604 RepID=A0AAN7T334_9EURO|nr:hypothetical protein LTR51_006526 [Lithohypha guttulata]KAK5088736.1 hypothetical protein LTR05_002957 [Lithohypha guttulata]KAK5106738.1 hypothetical protein LTS08_000860 [Lithohypha guttulata]